VATYTKALLSGSTNGRGVKVVAVATAGTLIHTAVAGTAAWDEVWLYAVNIDTTARKLTIEWGDPAVDDNIELTIPAESGLVLTVPGLLIQNELTVKAFASSANVVIIHGYVNEIT